MDIVFIGKTVLLNSLLPEELEEKYKSDFYSYPKALESIPRIKNKYEVIIIVLHNNLQIERENILELVKKLSLNPRRKLLVLSDDKYIDLTLQILSLGGFDFIRFPVKMDLFSKKRFQKKLLSVLDIIEKRNNLENKKIIKGDSEDIKSIATENDLNIELPPLVLIGISTGGPKILEEMFSHIKTTKLNYPIVVVLHMPDNYADKFIEYLNEKFPFKFEKVRKGSVLSSNTIQLLAGDKNMELSQRGFFIESKTQQEVYYKPSINSFFISAARHYKRQCVGILMSGLGDDGVEGLAMIKRKNGMTVVQDETSSVVFGMPQAAIENKVVDKVMSLEEISKLLDSLFLMVEKKSQV